MIPIYIDASEVASSFALSDREIESMYKYVKDSIVSNYAEEWEKQAKLNLNQTRERYIDSIVVVDEGPLTGSVLLVDDGLTGMIESGVGAFDMKPGFIKSPKAKTNKRGKKYLTIPFQFAAPTSIGESEVFSGKLPTSVHSAIVSKPQDVRVSGGGRRTKGLSFGEIPKGYTEAFTRPAVSNLPEKRTFSEYVNKTSIYQGVSRIQDPKTGQNVFMSFRRVSEDNSDPSSWVNKGINAYDLADKALTELNMEYAVGNSTDEFLSQIGYV